MKKHIAAYADLYRCDLDKANIYFAENLYRPFSELVERVHARRDFYKAHDVRDVKQDALLLILKILPTFDTTHEGKALTFFWRIVSNYLSNLLRASNRLPIAVSDEDLMLLIDSQDKSEPEPEFETEVHREFFLHYWTDERLRYYFRNSPLRVARVIVEIVRAGQGSTVGAIAERAKVRLKMVSYTKAKMQGLTEQAYGNLSKS